MAQQWDARARLALPELAGLRPGLEGTLEGQLHLTGPLATPGISGEVTGRGLGYQDIAVQALELEAELPALLQRPGRLSLSATGLRQGERSRGTRSWAWRAVPPIIA
ncbi:MAG: hypothetical protein U5L11_08075 [Arhodomonas sp.]|nr:hypothetical protein [Arhodomonas sp.]